MYRGIEVLRLVPDRPGRGGTKFGYHSFQQEPINDTRTTLNVNVYQDSWTSDRGIQAPPQFYSYWDTEACTNENSKTALALHGYAKYSLTDPGAGPATEILGHNTRINSAVTYGYIWNYTTVVSQDFEPPAGTRDTNVICDASTTNPAIFCNIGNRCFIATGIGPVVIYDSSRGTPTYYSTGLPTAYTLGIGSPKIAPVVDLDAGGGGTTGPGGVVPGAAAFARKDSPYLSFPDPAGALFNASTPAGDYLGFQADGVTYDPATGGPPPDTPSATSFSIDTRTTIFSTTGITVAIEMNSNIATIVAGSLPGADEWVGLTLTADGKPFVILAQKNSTQAQPGLGTKQLLLDRYNDDHYVGTWYFPADDTTPPSIVSGFAFTITGVRWRMTTGSGPAVPYNWAGGLTAGLYTVQGQLLDGVGGTDAGGTLTWDLTPPTYAYAWYDPITGHVSNISPTFTPSVVTVTDSGIRIPIDAGQISYPPNTTLFPYLYYYPRFTHIIFFRTLMAGGSTLYPIGSLDPTNTTEWKGLPNQVTTAIPPTTTDNFWYDTSRDSDLLVSGALRAPQFTNGRPTLIENGVETPIYPSHMAYWDSRLWVAGPQDPSAIHYSCDRVQCPFGRPEESFPDTNVLRIASSDGTIRGMKLIGENLLITTELWAYTVAGNNESNYRLIRVSTRMAGVGEYQMAEFTPEVAGQTSLVVFLGTDAKVYAMPLGGEAVIISEDIQTYLTDARLTARATYVKTRVHAITTEGRRIVALYCPVGATGEGMTFHFDFDTKTWTQHTLTSTTSTNESGAKTAFATVQTQLDYGEEIYAQPDAAAGGGVPTNGAIRLWQWMNGANPTGAQSIPSGYVRTFPLNLDGKKTRKQVHFIRLYVNDPGGGGWQVSLIKDSGTTIYNGTPTVQYDTAYNLLAVGGTPVDSSTDAELIMTDAALTVDAPIIGYTFDLQITFPSSTSKIYRLYRIEIGWSTLSEGQVDI